jgi:hypothetical protein
MSFCPLLLVGVDAGISWAAQTGESRLADTFIDGEDAPQQNVVFRLETTIRTQADDGI